MLTRGKCRNPDLQPGCSALTSLRGSDRSHLKGKVHQELYRVTLQSFSLSCTRLKVVLPPQNHSRQARLLVNFLWLAQFVLSVDGSSRVYTQFLSSTVKSGREQCSLLQAFLDGNPEHYIE